jgi:hypothetical protein
MRRVVPAALSLASFATAAVASEPSSADCGTMPSRPGDA